MAVLNSGAQFPLKMLSDLILYCSNFKIFHFQHYQDRPQGEGATGAFFPGPHPGRGPRRLHEGPLEYLFKRSIYSNRAVRSDTLIEQSQYSSEEQCSKLINKEIWLVTGSYCHTVKNEV